MTDTGWDATTAKKTNYYGLRTQLIGYDYNN